MDIVALKRAVAINGISGLCITKLDVLDGMEKLKVCIAYEYNGKRTGTRRWTRRAGKNAPRCTWSSRAGARTPTASPVGRPAAGRTRYLRSLEAGRLPDIVSTGPDRDHTMVLQDPFA